MTKIKVFSLNSKNQHGNPVLNAGWVQNRCELFLNMVKRYPSVKRPKKLWKGKHWSPLTMIYKLHLQQSVHNWQCYYDRHTQRVDQVVDHNILTTLPTAADRRHLNSIRKLQLSNGKQWSRNVAASCPMLLQKVCQPWISEICWPL